MSSSGVRVRHEAMSVVRHVLMATIRVVVG